MLPKVYSYIPQVKPKQQQRLFDSHQLIEIAQIYQYLGKIWQDGVQRSNVLSNNIHLIKEQIMGCSESHIKPVEQNAPPERREYAEIRPIRADEDSFEMQQPNNITRNMAPSNAADISFRSKENEQCSIDDKDEAEKIKVKRAKNYRIRPEHQRFIENILESNRAKAVTQFQPITSKPSNPNLKKTAISTYTKGQESNIDKENAQSHKQANKKGGKQFSGEGKFTKKQAQKIMNDIMQGKLVGQELNKIGERIDLEQIDSNATLQL